MADDTDFLRRLLADAGDIRIPYRGTPYVTKPLHLASNTRLTLDAGVEIIAAQEGFENRHAAAKDMEETCICRYLSADGKTLMHEPQDIWRMPTTEEIIRSLVGGGENAGCIWDKDSGKADCVRQPNKDTPLWAPDEEPIYYWSADEYDEESAWYVPYTGGIRYGGVIGHRPKGWGNPRHGYRCVREPYAAKESEDNKERIRICSIPKKIHAYFSHLYVFIIKDAEQSNDPNK